jgi:hypothetical protein
VNKKNTITNNAPTKTNEVKKETPQVKTPEETKIIEEKRKQIYLVDMPSDEKKLFDDLDSAIKTKDKTKEDELSKKIKELEVTKRTKLAEAVKNNDNETAKKIRKELRIFSIVEN